LLAPLKASDQIGKQIATYVEKSLKSKFLEVDVKEGTFPYLNKASKSGSMSSLQVCIIVSIQPDLLEDVVPTKNEVTAKRMEWSAINALTDLLVTPEVGFRLGRKLFRKSVPSANIIAPPSFQVSGQEVVTQLFVNYTPHVQRLDLINDCKKIEPRAKELIALVDCWAKKRKVCSAGRSDLTPMAWTLFAVYFLQVGAPGGPLLPPLHGLESSDGSAKFSISGDAEEWKAPAESPATAVSVGLLFKAFFEFYAKEFDWRNDVVSIRLGVRSAPKLNIPRHININADDGPCIEDPLDQTQKLTLIITSGCMIRVHEELARSVRLLQQGGSLSELLMDNRTDVH